MDSRQIEIKEVLDMNSSVKVSAQIVPFGHMSYFYKNEEVIKDEQKFPTYERQKSTTSRYIEIRF